MLSYSQRYKSYHRYVTEVTEDVLAATLFLPITIALYWWNTLAPTRAWNVGRHILLTPLYILKGLVSLTLAPLLAGLLAIPRAQNEIWRYPYFLGMTLELFNVNNLLPGYNPAHPLRRISYISAGLLLMILLTALLTVEFTPILNVALMMIPTVRNWNFAISAIAAATLGIEGHFKALSKFFVYQANSLVTTLQLWLLRMNINTFSNNEEVDYRPINEIPPEDRFVSTSNHVFDLGNLQESIAVSGLQNYYLDQSEQDKYLDAEDIVRLEGRHDLNRFPQLRDYLQAHREEYIRRRDRVISDRSLQLIEEVAYALDSDVDNGDQEKRGVIKNLMRASDTYHAHLASISPEERLQIENLNMYSTWAGGARLKDYLESVLAGEQCVKIAARDIRRAVARVRYTGDQDAQVLFWQRPLPTYGL